MSTLDMVSAAEDLSAFGKDALWVVLVKALLIFVILVVLTLFNIWFERRVVARMQHRIGPTSTAPSACCSPSRTASSSRSRRTSSRRPPTRWSSSSRR